MNTSKSRNQIVHVLPADGRALFLADLQLRELVTHERLNNGGENEAQVYFPSGAVVSVVSAALDAQMDVHSVGREGLLGYDEFVNGNKTDFDLICQIAGAVLHMSFETYERHRFANAALRHIVGSYTLVLLASLMQSVVCNGSHTIAQRCARGLLATSDRTGALDFPLTHELLSRALGVRRAGISLTLQHLQRSHIISSHNGKIVILDRRLLESESCECYRSIVRETGRIQRGRVSLGHQCP